MKSLGDLKTELDSLLREKNFDRVKSIIADATSRKGLIKPSGQNINFWNQPGFFYSQRGLFQQAADLYQALYEIQLREQQKNERFHKGMALHNLGLSMLNLDKRPEAQELITLAYIEDCITSGKNAVEQLAYKSLKNKFVVPEEILEGIYTCVTSRTTFAQYPPADPKIVLYEFHANQDVWIRRSRNNALVSLDYSFYNNLLGEVKNAKTNDEKKKTLEKLSEVLFSSIKGFTVLPAIRTSKAEIDRIIRNYADHTLLRDFGLYILIECKNWSKPVAAIVLRDFISKVRDHRCTSWNLTK